MAGIALRGHRLEFAGGPSLVAGITVDRSVSPSQREAVVMLLNLLNRDLPATDRMATVLATLSDVSENQSDVTFSAAYRVVHAA
ncbi:MAG: hypothetical protein DMG78_02815 [Acidobacteria bacterium]|nr:MAG: hypothetical protein DMG78_02815 [Acidobacteriota bacterium]